MLFYYFFPVYASPDFEVMTENYPPFNYIRDGEARGIVSDVVKEIKKRIGWENEIRLYSWNRAYESIRNEPNKILFSMAKTDIRTPDFKWVGPIVTPKGYFFKKNKKYRHKPRRQRGYQEKTILSVSGRILISIQFY